MNLEWRQHYKLSIFCAIIFYTIQPSNSRHHTVAGFHLEAQGLHAVGHTQLGRPGQCNTSSVGIDVQANGFILVLHLCGPGSFGSLELSRN